MTLKAPKAARLPERPSAPPPPESPPPGSAERRLMEVDWTRFWSFWGGPLGIQAVKIYFRYRLRSYHRLLRAAQRTSRIGSALELGAGTGLLSKALEGRYGFEMTLLDSNPAARRLYRLHSGAGRYLFEDLFQHRGRYDLVFSDGLIEHFQRRRRLQALRCHKRCAEKHVMVFVPKKSFFNRHLLFWSQTGRRQEFRFSPEQLLSEVEEAGMRPRMTVEDVHMIGVWAT